MNCKLPLTCLFLIYHVVLGSEEVTNEEFTENEGADNSLLRVRRGLNMLRLGRGLHMLRLGKRALPTLRLGRAPGDLLSNDDMHYILSVMRSNRQVPLPRYGKDLELQYWWLMNALMNAEQESEAFDESDGQIPEFGYELGNMPERQLKPIPRPGRFRRSADLPSMATDSELKNDDDLYDKRIAPLARYGKMLGGEGVETEAEKRAMRMLRLGRGMKMLRLGKRPDELDDDDVENEAEKRALRLLRLGKRPYKMLRLGRGYNDATEKRALRLLRLGKRTEGDESE